MGPWELYSYTSLKELDDQDEAHWSTTDVLHFIVFIQELNKHLLRQTKHVENSLLFSRLFQDTATFVGKSQAATPCSNPASLCPPNMVGFTAETTQLLPPPQRRETRAPSMSVRSATCQKLQELDFVSPLKLCIFLSCYWMLSPTFPPHGSDLSSFCNQALLGVRSNRNNCGSVHTNSYN